MFTHARAALLVLPFAVATMAVAQSTAPATSSIAAAALVENLVVPLHSQPADPIGGEYGVWAAGPRYKASFHDGFTFYPALGPGAPHHLPLAWRTEAAQVGEQPLPLHTAEVRWSGCRFERDFGELVEAYDVRADGIEQTFTLRSRPAGAGDLVITGLVTTPLSCEPVAAAQQDLVFTNGGADVIRYGKAVAFDAERRHCTVRTAWDGQRIRLSVPGAFLAQAQFPVVVDPLIGPLALVWPSALALPPVIAAQPESGGRILVAWSQFTGPDYDLYSISTTRDFNGVTGVHFDLTTSWSSQDVDASYVGTAARWLISQQRVFSTGSVARVYLQDVANTGLNSGTLVGPGVPFGFQDLAPVLGGSRYDGTALLVTNRLQTSTGSRAVVAWRINVAAATVCRRWAP